MTIDGRATAMRRQGRKLGKPRLLIVGCGDVGARIVARLNGRYRIIATTASPARHSVIRALGAVPIVVDLDDRRSLARLAPFGARVIHLAPTASNGTSDKRTKHLAAALSRDGSARSVYISTSGVYGDHQGRLIDETARQSPGSARATRRIDGERTMRRSMHSIVLRVPGIYADDRLPLERLRKSTPVLLAEDDVHTNHIHADDLARIVITALHRGSPTRSINASDDSDLKMADYFDLVADHFNLPRPPRRSRTEIALEATPMAMSFMNDSRRLDNRRLKRELRFRLDYPTVNVALAGLTRRINENGP